MILLRLKLLLLERVCLKVAELYTTKRVIYQILKTPFLIVTYQARGTLGRKILEGASEVKILDKIIPIKAKIEHINGYSSHADQKDLIVWVSKYNMS